MKRASAGLRFPHPAPTLSWADVGGDECGGWRSARVSRPFRFWGCGTNLTAPVDAAGGRGIGGSGGPAGTPRGTEDAAWDASGRDDGPGSAVGPTVKPNGGADGATARRDAGATGGASGAAGKGNAGHAGSGGSVPSGDQAADGGAICPASATPDDAGLIDLGRGRLRGRRLRGATRHPFRSPARLCPAPSSFRGPARRLRGSTRGARASRTPGPPPWPSAPTEPASC